MYNPTTFLKLGGGTPERLARLAKTLFVSVDQALTGIDAALLAGDIANVARIGHKVKASARWIGADELADMALRLEAMSSTDQLTAAAELRDRMHPHWQELKLAISNTLTKHGAGNEFMPEKLN